MKKRSGFAAALTLLGACALCCALPLLGGLAALGIGVSSLLGNVYVVAAAALLALLAGIWAYRRRQTATTACQTPVCHCRSCTAERS